MTIDARVAPILDKLMRLLEERFGGDLVSIGLYGSVARGTAGPDSDVDLLVVCRNIPESSLERTRALYPLLQSLQPDLERTHGETGWFPYLSVQMRTPEEASRTSRTYFDMVEEAVLLRDRDGFFRGVLDRLAARMKELGSRKIRFGDGYYWDLKPDLVWGEVFEV